MNHEVIHASDAKGALAHNSLRQRALERLEREGADYEATGCVDRAQEYLTLCDGHSDPMRGMHTFFQFPQNPENALDVPWECYVDGQTLFQGALNATVTVAHKSLQPVGKWRTICQDFCRDYAFYERAIQLQQERQLSRRIVLARNEAILLVVDELSRPRIMRENHQRDLKLTMTLEYPRELRAEQSSEFQEALLLAGPEPTDALARVFPLMAQERRADNQRDALTIMPRRRIIQINRERRGVTALSVLMIDFNARRLKRPYTWRPLAVGQDMRLVNEEEAVARIAQLGVEQYVLYASTSTRVATRSVLGLHTVSDFLFGKFTASRALTPIVDVSID